MFCIYCGKQLPDDAHFCMHCGKEAGTLTPFQSYIQKLEDHLGQKGQEIRDLECILFYAERTAGAMIKMKQYIFLKNDDQAGFHDFHLFSTNCTLRALQKCQGLPRGMQGGVVIYSVICQQTVNPDALTFVNQLAPRHYAAFEIPLIYELSTRKLYYCPKTPFWGFAMYTGIRKAAHQMLCIE